MRRTLINFTLIAVAAVGMMACNQIEADIEIVPEQQATTLYAYTAPSQTKVAFTDNTATIDLAWEDDDEFTVYDGDTQIGTFICEDKENGQFSSTDAVLVDGTEYTAVYGSTENLYTQDGDQINNLDAACYMTTSFIYTANGDNAINFAHQMAIMTFKFESTERPARLVFENGTEVYTVNYSTIIPNDNLYTSHIMINPCGNSETARTLTFSLYAASEDGGVATEAYDVRTVTTTKAYEAGLRYTSPVSNLDPTIWIGSGTQDDPYQITTAAQLRLLAANVNAGTNYSGEYFNMTKDIDLGGIDTDGSGIEANEFIGIGDYDNSFQGSFDGNNFEVSGLYIYDPNDDHLALFRNINGATIKNLGVSGSVSAGFGRASGIVANASGSCIISNCYNKASITIIDTEGNSGTAGIVGRIIGSSSNYSQITNCYNIGTINNTLNETGGIAGSADYTYITNCYNSATINGSKNVGGIVGSTNYTDITNCYNSATIEGSQNVGGIVGAAFFTDITNCYNSATSTGVGIAAYAFRLTVSNCYYNSAGNTDSNATAKTSDEMRNEEFATLLNQNAYDYNKADGTTIYACGWDAATDSYPTLNFYMSPTGTDDDDVVDPDINYNNDNDVYEIYNAKGMIAFADLTNGFSNTSGAVCTGSGFAMFGSTKYTDINGKLMTDITLTEEWTPMCMADNYTYEGIFDGNGHTVSGISINLPSSENLGFFSSIASCSIIKNLTVKGEIIGLNNVGGISGYVSYTSTLSDIGYIVNCTNHVTLKGSKYVGGLIGNIHSTDYNIINCYNTATIEGSDYCAAGLVGYINYLSNTNIVNCYSNATVIGTQNIRNLVGYINNSIITDCIYSSDMSSELYVAMLNNGAYNHNQCVPEIEAYAWTMGSEGYPIYDTVATASLTDISNPSLTEYGSGTESDPYCIITAAQMQELATNVNAGTSYSGTYFRVLCDIDLEGSQSNPYTAIGNKHLDDASSSTPFSGTFDGNGHNISNLYIDAPSDYMTTQGLFGYIDGAEIKGLNVSGSIAGYFNVGGIVGYAYNSIISECSNKATIVGSSNYIGGIVGCATLSTVEKCYNQANISGYAYIGAIAGAIAGSTITDCCTHYSETTMSLTAAGSSLGGIVGAAESYSDDTETTTQSSINNCYINKINISSISKELYGYIVASLRDNSSIISCYSPYDQMVGSQSETATVENIEIIALLDMKNNSEFVTKLGNSFKYDYDVINNYYPILSWQTSNY